MSYPKDSFKIALGLLYVLILQASNCELKRFSDAEEGSKPYEISTAYKAKNYNDRQRFLVLHYTASNLPHSLATLTAGPESTHQVSAHYVVPEEPINNKRLIYQLVPEEKRAWTQGVSYWRGRNNLNDTGVGVEIVNLGYHGNPGKEIWVPFKPYQIETVIVLCQDIIKRYNIEPTNVIGHGDVAPGRKVDPGPLFPWKQLYDNGIGAWPDQATVAHFKKTLPDQVDVQSVQKDLGTYGYQIEANGIFGKDTKTVVRAFQMHFRPQKCDGVIDKETVAILKALLKKYRTN